MKLFRLAFLCCILAVLGASPARSEPAGLRLTAFSVEKLDTGPTEALRILSHIQIDNSSVVRDQLRDGAHMVLKAEVSLHRLRSLLSNQLLGVAVLELHLRHDPLRRDFIVFHGKQLYQNRSLEQVLSTAWDAAALDLTPETPLEAGQEYRVTLHLSLQHAEVPPWLEKALFFWSWDVVPPISVTQDFQF